MSSYYENYPRDLRSKFDASSHNRKRKFEHVPRMDDAPKRRRAREDKGNVTRPISFKELEQISRESSPALKLINEAERFEALLASEKLSNEESNPEFLKLVISAFYLLCSANNLIAENVDRILRSPTAKNFIAGTVLSSFINEMPHANHWKDENDRFCTVSNLTVIFVTFLQKFGKDLVYKLPLAQLSTSVKELKELNLVQDADHLDEKIQQLEELRSEAIRCAKFANDQKSQGEPPENFRELSVIPQVEDLIARPFLRENITDRRFKDLDHYLDVQFRLLREDFVKPLRDGIHQLKKSSALEPNHEYKLKRANEIHVYHDVTIQFPVCGRKSRLYKIRFDSSHQKVARVNWDRTKRLKYGTLLCLSADDFNTLVFATVENPDSKELKEGLLEVRFGNISSEEVNQFLEEKQIFVMIESPAYFESYRHVLEALKEINSQFPFQKQIVECCGDVEPPEYQIQEENDSKFKFHFDGVLDAKREAYSELPELAEQQDFPSTMEIVSDASAGVEISLENEIPSALQECQCTPNDHCWPDRESLGLNESQMRAFKMALTKRLAVIQGPPGTGKTYVGWKIARVLLQTPSLWEDEKERKPILMVSYTNHALDQFLEGVLSTTKNVIRVGGRKISGKLENYSLKNLRWKIRWKKVVPDEIYRARLKTENDTKGQKFFSKRSFAILRSLRTSVVSMKVLGHHDYALKAHYSQLDEEAGPKSIDEALLDWLRINRRDKREQEFPLYGDLDGEVYGYGYDADFDNEPFDDKDLNHMAHSNQIAILSPEDTTYPEEIRRNILSEEFMTGDEEMHLDDIYRLETKDRWRLYRLWRKRAEEYHQKLFLTRQNEYDQAVEREQEIIRMEEYEVLREACVIGMTTTCAAKYRSILKEIRPRIVIVEEAAEVLEAHIIASLTSGCQHLILIGDHQQLRPTPAVYDLAKRYKLDVSLFERMVNVGIQCETLNVQHRMRPEISALMKHIYDDLENHESVEKYEDIKGMKKNMFFINHNYMEDSCNQSHSHVNEHEAKFLVALCRHLMQQGYKADQITLLTTYTGQMYAIRDCLQEEDAIKEPLKPENDSSFRDVRVTTVDNFQGEENDIILLSLVRSNKDEKVGFIKIVNRACVALSRARKGFYCIGNFGLLSKHSDIWKKIVTDLKASSSIGNVLPVVCQIHNDEISVKTAEDFNTKVPMGGCQRPCTVRLKCGHACPLACHPSDRDHVEFRCQKPCEKKRARCDHTCPKRCWEVCEQNCEIEVEKELPICGHTMLVRCDTNPVMLKCQKRCEKDLSCGHRCQSKCGESCTEKCREIVKKTDWPCGHLVSIACSATPNDCFHPCEATLECGHACSGTCGECRMGRIHKRCKLHCGRVLICSHSCMSRCKESCPPCSAKCENLCGHSECPEKCGEPCTPCQEECLWKCPHHACTKKCSEMCERPRCNEPCNQVLSCGHDCCGLCKEECICAECTPVREIFFGTEENESARFLKLPDCQHVFEVTCLDRWMDQDDGVIRRKQCPRCNTPVRKSLRYGNVIKQQRQDIERVKRELMGNKTELERKKRRLFVRASEMLKTVDQSVKAYLEKRKNSIWETMKSEMIAAIIENQLMLVQRLDSTGKKMQSVLGTVYPENCSEKKLQRQRMTEELSYLKKRLLSDRVGQLELRDINTEFSRLNLQLELYSLNCDIRSLKVELDEPSRQMMTAIQKELSGGQRIADEELDKLVNNIATIRTTNPRLNKLTPEEKKQIVTAMNLKPGHWHKCPQGHIYVITECGGAMEKSKCPDCGAVIGGENHKLAQDNQLATEMDGARYSAWSEQANLANYGNLDEIV